MTTRPYISIEELTLLFNLHHSDVIFLNKPHKDWNYYCYLCHCGLIKHNKSSMKDFSDSFKITSKGRDFCKFLQLDADELILLMGTGVEQTTYKPE